MLGPSPSTKVPAGLTSLLEWLQLPALRLAALSIASAAIYLFGLVLPYNLFRWIDGPRQNLGSITGYDPVRAISFVLSFVILFGAYWLALRIAESSLPDRGLWAAALGGAATFCLILIFLQPFGANDVFEYIIVGRIQAIYGGNPFYDTPARYAADPFFRYSYWTDVTTAYGPIWEIFNWMIVALAGDGPIESVLAFKVTMVAIYGLILLVIGLTISRQGPQRVLYGVVYFGWNPLVLYSVAGHAHNDTFMILAMVLGFLFLAEERYTLAALMQTAGALIKYIPALVFPVVILAALKALPDMQARLRYLVMTATACGGLVFLAFLPYWEGGDILSIGRRTELFTTSIPTLIQLALDVHGGLEREASQRAAAFAGLGLLLVGMAWQLWMQWHSKRRDAPVRSATGILLIYLLAACPWFQPWYVMWPLALAALLAPGPLSHGVIVFSLAVTWKFPIFHFILVRGQRPAPTRSMREPWLTTLTLALPWVYFLWFGLQKRREGEQHLPPVR